MEIDNNNNNENNNDNNNNNNFNFTNNEDIKNVLNQFKCYLKQTEDKDRLISVINPNLDIYYNSLNICVGKQSTGKTTLLLKQLLILNNVPSNYNLIIYLSNSNDQYFMNTIQLFTKIKVVQKSFDEGTEALDDYLNSCPNRDGHIFVIIEDATGLLEGRNILWEQWLIKLRHLRMTVWINLHDWVSISPKIREQVSTVFICKGYAKSRCSIMFKQLSVPLENKVIYGMYSQLRNHQYLKIDNIKGKVKIID